MQTVHDLVRLAASRAPRQLAIVADRSARRLTYAELLQAIDRLAAGLARRGIAAGARVATCLPNLYDHALALLALDRLGAVPALINARLKPEDVSELIRQGTMRAAIVAAERAFAGAARAALPPSAPLITVGGAVDGSADLATCADEAAAPPAYVRPAPDATAFVFYTSGTTGLPKGAEIPHRAAEARLLYMSTQCGMTHGPHNRVLG